MTEYIVRAGGQGEGGTLPTLSAAAAVAKRGDVVIVEPGIYREILKPGAGTTWLGQPGAVIDGGWDRKSVGTQDGATVQIDAPDTTLRGFLIRNCKGHGLAVARGGDGALIEDIHIEWCFRGGVILNGMGELITNVTFRNVHARHMVLSWKIAPTMLGAGCWAMRYARNVVVDGCSVAGGHGEGMAAGVLSRNVVIKNTTLHTTAHLPLYVSNRAQKVTVSDCVLFQTGDAAYLQSDGEAGVPLVIGDETRPDSKDDKWPHAEDVLVERCLVVGGNKLFEIRNRLKAAGGAAGQYDGYETRIQNLAVRDCTFVSTITTGPRAVTIIENPIGHKISGIFERCVFVTTRSRSSGPAEIYNAAAGVKFRDCRFTHPPANAGTSNSQIEAAALVAPLIDVGGTADEPVFDIDNYRPRPGGPLVVDGRAVAGALEPEGPPPPPPPDPDEDGVDWDALLVTAQTIDANLASVAMALDAAQSELAALRAELEGYKAA